MHAVDLLLDLLAGPPDETPAPLAVPAQGREASRGSPRLLLHVPVLELLLKGLQALAGARWAAEGAQAQAQEFALSPGTVGQAARS